MKTPSVLAGLLMGAVLGAVLVVACSDDSPADVDAAVCDCPAAEPPLAGRIIVRTQPVSIAAGSFALGGAGCLPGETLLSGGCRLDVADDAVTLIEAGPNRMVPTQPSYQCAWNSTSATARTGTAEVICLLPPPQ